MRLHFHIALILILAVAAHAVSKPHVITFGKWSAVKSSTASDESHSDDLKVRALYVDGRVKEFTFGISHDVTDRLFVVRRVIRLNDALPQEAASTPRWTWQRGGWLVIDRVTGHIAQANLPEFDPDASSASWYRDYVAYCGVSDDGRKIFAVVAQLGPSEANFEEAARGSRWRAGFRSGMRTAGVATRAYTRQLRFQIRPEVHLRRTRPYRRGRNR